MEIERKFLIDRFPNELPLLEEAEVYQGYLCVNPVVRIRSKRNLNEENYVLCFKGKGTLVRSELEMPLTKEQFEQLRGLLSKPMIHKIYRVYALETGLKLECNVVDPGTPDEFMYAEVEFSSVEQANAFVPPSYLGKDVTETPGYSMGAYWARKSPSV